MKVKVRRYFWTTRGSLRRGRVTAHLSRGQGPPYPPPPFSLLSVNTAERHRAPSCTLCSWFERGGKWRREHVFFPPDCSDWARKHVFSNPSHHKRWIKFLAGPGRPPKRTSTHESASRCVPGSFPSSCRRYARNVVRDERLEPRPTPPRSKTNVTS